jgi:hypothetical protein
MTAVNSKPNNSEVLKNSPENFFTKDYLTFLDVDRIRLDQVDPDEPLSYKGTLKENTEKGQKLGRGKNLGKAGFGSEKKNLRALVDKKLEKNEKLEIDTVTLPEFTDGDISKKLDNPTESAEVLPKLNSLSIGVVVALVEAYEYFSAQKENAGKNFWDNSLENALAVKDVALNDAERRSLEMIEKIQKENLVQNLPENSAGKLVVDNFSGLVRETKQAVDISEKVGEIFQKENLNFSDFTKGSDGDRDYVKTGVGFAGALTGAIAGGKLGGGLFSSLAGSVFGSVVARSGYEMLDGKNLSQSFASGVKSTLDATKSTANSISTQVKETFSKLDTPGEKLAAGAVGVALLWGGYKLISSFFSEENNSSNVSNEKKGMSWRTLGVLGVIGVGIAGYLGLKNLDFLKGLVPDEVNEYLDKAKKAKDAIMNPVDTIHHYWEGRRDGLIKKMEEGGHKNIARELEGVDIKKYYEENKELVKGLGLSTAAIVGVLLALFLFRGGVISRVAFTGLKVGMGVGVIALIANYFDIESSDVTTPLLKIVDSGLDKNGTKEGFRKYWEGDGEKKGKREEWADYLQKKGLPDKLTNALRTTSLNEVQVGAGVSFGLLAFRALSQLNTLKFGKYLLLSSFLIGNYLNSQEKGTIPESEINPINNEKVKQTFAEKKEGIFKVYEKYGIDLKQTPELQKKVEGYFSEGKISEVWNEFVSKNDSSFLEDLLKGGSTVLVTAITVFITSKVMKGLFKLSGKSVGIASVIAGGTAFFTLFDSDPKKLKNFVTATQEIFKTEFEPELQKNLQPNIIEKIIPDWEVLHSLFVSLGVEGFNNIYVGQDKKHIYLNNLQKIKSLKFERDEKELSKIFLQLETLLTTKNLDHVYLPTPLLTRLGYIAYKNNIEVSSFQSTEGGKYTLKINNLEFPGFAFNPAEYLGENISEKQLKDEMNFKMEQGLHSIITGINTWLTPDDMKKYSLKEKDKKYAIEEIQKIQARVEKNGYASFTQDDYKHIKKVLNPIVEDVHLSLNDSQIKVVFYGESKDLTRVVFGGLSPDISVERYKENRKFVDMNYLSAYWNGLVDFQHSAIKRFLDDMSGHLKEGTDLYKVVEEYKENPENFLDPLFLLRFIGAIATSAPEEGIGGTIGNGLLTVWYGGKSVVFELGAKTQSALAGFFNPKTSIEEDIYNSALVGTVAFGAANEYISKSIKIEEKTGGAMKGVKKVTSKLGFVFYRIPTKPVRMAKNVFVSKFGGAVAKGAALGERIIQNPSEWLKQKRYNAHHSTFGKLHRGLIHLSHYPVSIATFGKVDFKNSLILSYNREILELERQKAYWENSRDIVKGKNREFAKGIEKRQGELTDKIVNIIGSSGRSRKTEKLPQYIQDLLIKKVKEGDYSYDLIKHHTNDARVQFLRRNRPLTIGEMMRDGSFDFLRQASRNITTGIANTTTKAYDYVSDKISPRDPLQRAERELNKALNSNPNASQLSPEKPKTQYERKGNASSTVIDKNNPVFKVKGVPVNNVDSNTKGTPSDSTPKTKKMQPANKTLHEITISDGSTVKKGYVYAETEPLKVYDPEKTPAAQNNPNYKKSPENIPVADSRIDRSPVVPRIKKAVPYVLIGGLTALGIYEGTKGIDERLRDSDEGGDTEKTTIDTKEFIALQKKEADMQRQYSNILASQPTPPTDELSKAGFSAFTEQEKKYSENVATFIASYEEYLKGVNRNTKLGEALSVQEGEKKSLLSLSFEGKKKDLAYIEKKDGKILFHFIEPSDIRTFFLDTIEADERLYMMIFRLLPGTGDALDFKDAYKYAEKGDYTEATKSAAFGVVGTALTIGGLFTFGGTTAANLVARIATHAPEIVRLVSRASGPAQQVFVQVLEKIPEKLRTSVIGDLIKKFKAPTTLNIGQMGYVGYDAITKLGYTEREL